MHAADGHNRNHRTKIVFVEKRKRKEKEIFHQLANFVVFAFEGKIFRYQNMRGRDCSCRESKSITAILMKDYSTNQNVKTYFDAVKIRLSTHVISLIEASVFISAKASNVFTFHNRISPPRQAESRISE